MSELTQSAGAGSCQMDGYVQGNQHRVDDKIFERNLSILKFKFWGQMSFYYAYNTNV
jgi:hypothetical protein